MKIGEVLSEVFFPSGITCLACGDEVFEDNELCLCRRCKMEANLHFCLACGRTIYDMADFCDYCKQARSEFTTARAPFVYNDVAKRIVYKLKYGSGKYIARVMAEAMVKNFKTHGWQIDEVTFVPMHKKRLRTRGYNQAELIAQHFAKLTDLPLIDYLNRVKYTDNLARMSRAKRQEAIKGALALKPQVKKCAPSILLIDDVFTTSTTANECARLLKTNKAKAVYIQTFATATITPDLY